MAKFFDLFPKIAYDLNDGKFKNYNQVTNIFFRFRVIRSVLNNISAYYEYIVREGDTPEILAEKIYGDPEAHWIILMANDMLDAQYDWPLNDKNFRNYIFNKYYNDTNKSKIQDIDITNAGSGYSNGYIIFEGGSGINANAKITVNGTGVITSTEIFNRGSSYRVNDVVTANIAHLNGSSGKLSVVLSKPTLGDVVSWSQTNYHHYEKVIERTESLSGIVNETRLVINKSSIANTVYYANNTNEVDIFVTNINGTLNLNSGTSVNTTNNIFVGNVKSITITDSNAQIKFANASGYFSREQKLSFKNNTAMNCIITYATSPVGSLLQDPTIPYYSYDDVADTLQFEVFNMGYQTKNTTNTLIDAGRSISEVIYRQAVSNYDYEVALNEQKRTIKIIKPEYYPQIIEEFDNLVKNRISYLRRLIV